jgi:hypothetical protein
METTVTPLPSRSINIPKEVFNPVNDVRGWWSEEIEGATDELGAEFLYRHKDIHRSTQNITESTPGKTARPKFALLTWAWFLASSTAAAQAPGAFTSTTACIA